jgi:hypothetical protein
VYRNVRNWTKPKQNTDQPLSEWVHNKDFDESFACDVLSYSPRVVAVYLARAAFWPTLYWTSFKSLISKSNNWMNAIDENIILGALPRGRAADLKVFFCFLVLEKLNFVIVVEIGSEVTCFCGRNWGLVW